MERRHFLKALIGLPIVAAVGSLPKMDQSPIKVTNQGEVVIDATKGLRIMNGADVAALYVAPASSRKSPQVTNKYGLQLTSGVDKFRVGDTTIKA